jgi:hypothetical protein
MPEAKNVDGIDLQVDAIERDVSRAATRDDQLTLAAGDRSADVRMVRQHSRRPDDQRWHIVGR